KCVMPEYEFVGTLRNADLTGEGCFIAFRKDDFVLLSLDTFWLSPTPAVPGSRFEEQSKYPRICVAAYLYHKESGKFLWVYDAHLDHISESARVLGMKCLLARMKENNARNPAPTFLLGDFNTRPGTDTLHLIESTAEPALTELTASVPGTFHNFGKETDNPRKIDYIYASGEVKAENVCTVETCKDGIFLSDHYPVAANFTF
ncbi:MAG: endonuclease/exonuclease/phosphatase family protein, partial [Clostridia bacterium]|nr:endonuclease/exonuclease/phosphatase family protein [Clostridia bacterium]